MQSRAALKVLIIPDKFKGTLTARQAGEAIAAGWRAIRPDDQLEILPMSDGGDGFGEIIGGMMGAEAIEVETVDAAHRPLQAKFWLHPPSSTAIIEAAQVNGLALLPPGKFHPFELDTYGLGAVYRSAIETRVENVLVGIGGSSTNDGGFGLASSLGWKFLDANENEIAKWTDLDRLAQIIRPTRPFRVRSTSPRFRSIIAVDVQNPLLGPNGASRIYGPQKGLREEDMQKAEACLARLSTAPVELLPEWSTPEPGKKQTDHPYTLGHFARSPGAGAAGGLGFGFSAFFNARFMPGFEIFAEAANLTDRLKKADLVISGEGAMDAQSLMGKGVGSLFQWCRQGGVKFIGLAGSLSHDVLQKFPNGRSLSLWGIVPNLAPLDQAKAEPDRWLRALASEAAKKHVSV